MIEPVYRDLGAKLGYIRTTLGFSQEEFARKVGLTRTSIANIEAGRQRILLHQVETFASALKMTPRSFLRDIFI